MEILLRIQKVLWEQGHVTGHPITQTDDLAADLKLDSYDRLELLFELEREFGITLNIDKNIGTVADVVNYIAAELEMRR